MKRRTHRVIHVQPGVCELWLPIRNSRRMLLVEQQVKMAKLELQRLPPRKRGTRSN